jgi:hypothetical protein
MGETLNIEHRIMGNQMSFNLEVINIMETIRTYSCSCTLCEATQRTSISSISNDNISLRLRLC